MTKKELRKLRKIDLLEMLLEQTKEIENLKEELKKMELELNNKEIKITNSGSIAEASMNLHNIFQTAQEIANQYIQNVEVATQKQLKDLEKKEIEHNQKLTELMIEAQNECYEMKRLTAIECKKRLDKLSNNN